MWKKYTEELLTKENIKEKATEVLEMGASGATEVAHGFLNGILMKIVFTVIVVILLIGGGCVGTNMVIDAVSTKG